MQVSLDESICWIPYKHKHDARIQVFRQVEIFCKCTKYPVDSKSNDLVNIYSAYKILPRNRAKTQEGAFKRFQTENNDRNKPWRHLYLSIFPRVTHS